MTTGKDRQRQLAREHHERQMQRRAEREQKAKRTAIIGSTVGVVIVIGGIVTAVALLGGGDTATDAAASPSAPAASPADTAAPSPSTGPKPYDAAAGTCDYVPDSSGGQVKDVGMPPTKVKTTPATKQMTLKTNLGDIVVDLDNAKAPCTTNSLEFLAKKNFYNGSKCHRLGSAQFPMLQCGDPTAKADGKSQDGAGGPGYVMAEENLQGAQYKRGVMAMAKTQAPGSTGSQFFLVFGDIGLTPDYTPVGTITKGLDILDKVNKAGVIADMGDGTGAPKQTVEIKDVTIAGKS
ncbi:peptidylprolyl isomerase [Nonomuraea jiangxiensis]|uniref:peptidylprolyl isomerase n=1 Tax=Nonomuraea jiangxiensis TaxID=633440 RepID=A0A1G9M3H5_9ACTN|nr:peptidyl-prolyl cis-trans isomerase B (cyclophilin B) [Nonomuraea jiangxiensis]